MSARDIIVNQDANNNVLYVIKKEFKGECTINISVTPDVTARVDQKTKKIVGLTIEEFSKTFPRLVYCSEYELMEHFDTIIELINAPHLIPNNI